MSVQAIAWVLDHSEAKGTARCVLISIANHVDPDGIGWVHVRRVLREANCSLGSYRSAVHQAEARGELVREPHGGGSARLHDRHRPNLFTFPALAGQPVEPAREPDREAEQADSSVRRVFEAWRAATGKDPAKLTADRRAKITARLREGYTVDDLVAAVEGVALSPWHMGENPSGVRYDDLTLVLRDGTHTERFMALGDGSGGNPPPGRSEALRTPSSRVSREDSPVLARVVKRQRGCDGCDMGWLTDPDGKVRLCPVCDREDDHAMRDVRDHPDEK